MAEEPECDLTNSSPLHAAVSKVDSRRSLKELGEDEYEGTTSQTQSALFASFSKLGTKHAAAAVSLSSRLTVVAKEARKDREKKKGEVEAGEESEEPQPESRRSRRRSSLQTQQHMSSLRDLMRNRYPGQRTHAECAIMAETLVPLGHCLFDAFGELACLQFMQEAIFLRFRKDDDVYDVGDPGEDIYLVLSGSVFVGNSTSTGSYCGPGTFFGESALIPGGCERTTKATVHEGVCEMIAIPVDFFHEIAAGIVNSEELRQEILCRIAERGDSQASLRDRKLLLDIMKSSDDPDTQKFVSDFDPGGNWGSLLMLRVLKRMTLRQVPKDEFVTKQGDEDDELFFVLSGRVGIETQKLPVNLNQPNTVRSKAAAKALTKATSRELQMKRQPSNVVSDRVMEPGCIFGFEVLDTSREDCKRAFSTRAMEDTALYVLRVPDLHDELNAWTTLQTKVFEIVRNLPPMKWTDKTLQVLLDFVCDTPFLQGHEPTVQKKILKAMRRRELKEDTVLFHQREVAPSFFILLDGQMSIHWRSSTAEGSSSISMGRTTLNLNRNTLIMRQSYASRGMDVDEDVQGCDVRKASVQLNVLGPGATFGERSLQNREEYPFTAIAETPCELLELSRSAFEKVMGMTETVHQKAVEIIKSAPPVGHTGNRPRYRPKDLALLCTLVESNPNFGHMPQKTIQEMMLVASYLHKEANRVVFREGDEGDMFYITLSGKVGVYKEQPNEKDEQEKAAEEKAGEAQKEKEKGAISKLRKRAKLIGKLASKHDIGDEKPGGALEKKPSPAKAGKDSKGLAQKADKPGSPPPSPKTTARKTVVASPAMLEVAAENAAKKGDAESTEQEGEADPQAADAQKRASIEDPEEAEGRILLVALGPGAAFGERALLHAEPRAATLKTMEPSEFLVLSKESFDAVLKVQMQAEMQQCATFLKQWLPGAATLPKQGVEKLATTCGKVKVLPRGKVLIAEGSRSEKVLWILVEGSWAVLVPSRNGTKGKPAESRRVLHQTPVAAVIATPGAIVGDISCMGLPEPATIRVTSATCEAYSIHWSDIVRHLPAAGIEVIKERGMEKFKWRSPANTKPSDHLRESGAEAAQLSLSLKDSLVNSIQINNDKFSDTQTSLNKGCKVKDAEGLKEFLNSYFHGKMPITEPWHEFVDAAMGCNARAGLDMSHSTVHSRVIEGNTDAWRSSNYSADVEEACEVMIDKLDTIAASRGLIEQSKASREARTPPNTSKARIRAEVMSVLHSDPTDAVQKVMRKIQRLPTHNLSEWIKILMTEPRIYTNDKIRAVIGRGRERQNIFKESSKGSTNTPNASIGAGGSQDWCTNQSQTMHGKMRPKSARASMERPKINDEHYTRAQDYSMLIQTLPIHEFKSPQKPQVGTGTPNMPWKVNAQAEHEAAKARMNDLVNVQQELRIAAGLPPLSPTIIMQSEDVVNVTSEATAAPEMDESLRIPVKKNGQEVAREQRPQETLGNYGGNENIVKEPEEDKADSHGSPSAKLESSSPSRKKVSFLSQARTVRPKSAGRCRPVQTPQMMVDNRKDAKAKFDPWEGVHVNAWDSEDITSLSISSWQPSSPRPAH